MEKELKKLEKTAQNLDKPKTKGKSEEQAVYKFSHVDYANSIAANVIKSEDGDPTLIVYEDGKIKEGLNSYTFPDGITIAIPPKKDKFYKGVYSEVILPDAFIEDDVKTEDVDNAIEKVLRQWFVQDDVYFVIARNYIKFSWVYERFLRSPYLNVYGDWGTGKSEWSKFLIWMCMSGLCIEDVSYAALSRILDLTNCSVVLDEADFLDRSDAEKMRTILRNGYKRNGMFRVAEQDAKKFVPTSYLVDQPKIIVKRKTLKDDALQSRSIPLKMIPRDNEIPNEMRRDVERGFENLIRRSIQNVVNLLLRWRFQHLFNVEQIILIEGMNVRYNDTLMPLLKLSTEKDQKLMVKYMKRIEREALAATSDDYNIMIVRVIIKLHSQMPALLIKDRSGQRIMVSQISSHCIEDYEGDVGATDVRKWFSSRKVARALRDMGFPVDSYANKACIYADKIKDLMKRMILKYKLEVPPSEEPKEEESIELP